MSDVFISYSRANAGFAHKLAAELKKLSYEVWVDVVGIPFTSEWWAEIRRGIESADNFVLVMSPDSLGSPVCHLEIEYARQLNKRIIPVNHVAVKREDAAKRVNDRILDDAYITELVGDRSPMLLFNANWQFTSSINWFNYSYDAANPDEAEERRFYETLPAFVEALNVDMVHVRQHTRLLTRAKDWLNNQQNSALLLVGDDVVSAEEWLTDWEQDKIESVAKNQPPKAPQPNDEIRDFIDMSRQEEDERQWQLHELETSREWLETQARTTQRIVIPLVILLAFLFLGVLIIFTETQNKLVRAEIRERIHIDFTNILLQFVNNSTEMISQLDALAMRYPDEPLPYLIRGTIYTYDGNFEQAISDYTQAITLNPNNSVYYSYRGYSYKHRGELDKALDDYNQAIILNPQDALAYNYRGLAYADQDKFDLAVADYTQAIILNPQDAFAYNNRGIVYADQGELDLAITDYTQAITLNPQLAAVYYNRGNAYTDQDKFDLAITDYTQAITLNPELAQAYTNRGLAYANQEEFDLAIADYSQIIILNPQDALAYTNRGNAYADQDKFDLAIADYTQAIILNPQDALAYTNRGNAYTVQDKFDLAIDDHTQAIILNPELAQAYTNRGTVYHKQGEFDLAIADYTQAITLNPELALVYTNRGLTYYFANEPALAMADFEQYERLGKILPPDFQTIRDEIESQLQLTATPDN